MSAWGKKKEAKPEQEDTIDRHYHDEKEPHVPVNVVQLDGLVLLKMIKHCTENVPEVVTGQLLGLDVDDKLEVTNCFPVPMDANDDEADEYQLEMMKSFRNVNVDNNTVGWYQSALLGSWLNASIIETQYGYQKEIPNSVVVVYDPFRTSQGRLALKAYRLTSGFMRMYAAGDLSSQGFAKNNVDHSSIFEEIPIKVHNSHLVHGFLYELREKGSMNCDSERLQSSSGAFLEKTLGVLSSTIDEYASDQSKFLYQQRLIARNKRAADEAGDAEPSKPVVQPSRLEAFLLSNQLSNYCDQVQSASKIAFNKLYVAEALAKTPAAAQTEAK